MFKFFKNHRGATNVIIATIGAVSTILASVFMSMGASSAKVNEIDKKLATVEERETNHYSEIEKKLGNIEGKLDKFIDAQLANRKSSINN